MKQIAIVAPHFPPCNVTGVHRSRFISAHLKKYGWEPVVLTVKPEYYEERLDPELESLLPKDLTMVRTAAFGTKPIRIVGDISLRCFLWHWAELRRLAKNRRLDFVYISLYPAYTALLGRLIHAEFKIPYAIDYQDPWVEYRRVRRPFFSKARWSQNLARLLEPFAIKKASIVTAVAASYYEGVVERNPSLQTAIKIEMPIGFDPHDHEIARRHGGEPLLFENKSDLIHLIYAGAVLPESIEVWSAFFKGLQSLQQKDFSLFSKIRLLCIGTGKKTDDPNDFVLKPIADACGLGNTVIEHPARMPYTDVLRHLAAADTILVIGSTEKHYTASKIFQAVFSKRPIFSLLHRQSSAFTFLRESRAGQVVDFESVEELRSMGLQIGASLQAALKQPFSEAAVDYAYFDRFTAQSLTAKLADALDQVTR